MTKDRFTEENVFFTADTHFNDEFIIKMCDRPYKTIDEMNDALIDRWNKVVKPTDIVFHLGDFARGDKDNIKNILNRLNGRIYLIAGDHDRMSTLKHLTDRFEEITPQKTIYVGEQKILLNHYPFLTYSGAHRDVWQLFGHLHLRPTAPTPTKLQLLFPTQHDVGVDNNDFTPVSYNHVEDIITKQVTINQNNKYGNKENGFILRTT